MRFDALVVVSFGGPEGPGEVGPFLENVVRGRNVPAERLSRVAEQYMRFGGVSPINDHNRRLTASLQQALSAAGRDLPVYWGNRNWHPYLADTVARMRDDGVTRAAALVTSAYSSYSSCRQYLDDIDAARAVSGAGAPEIVKLRPFYNHPGFVEPFAGGLRSALGALEASGTPATVLMTAHSIPLAMAQTCDYEAELAGVAAEVAAGETPYQLVFQSRSGPPGQPWLGPDVNDAIRALPAGAGTVVVVPIGFVSDHMEVVHDLDLVAAATASGRGLGYLRVATPGADPRFAPMVLDLLDEVENPRRRPRVVGSRPPAPCPCRPGCCPAPAIGGLQAGRGAGAGAPR